MAAGCNFPEFNRDTYCRVAADMLFVGDSIVRQSYLSLVGLLGGRNVCGLNRTESAAAKTKSFEPPIVECLEGGEYLVASICAHRYRIVYVHDSYLNTSRNFTASAAEASLRTRGAGCIHLGLNRLAAIARAEKTPVNKALWSWPHFVRCFSVVVWNYGIFHALQKKDEGSYVQALRAVDSWLSNHFNGAAFFQGSLPGAGNCGCAVAPSWHTAEGALPPLMAATAALCPSP